jgi:D-serine deaminase-like pyridoxal phosphate-dependent protein
MNLVDLQTPCLLLDKTRMLANIRKLQDHLKAFEITLRPHVKTAKCPEIVNCMFDSPPGPVTVSTLQEAEQFIKAGYRDILYAVGIAPDKMERIVSLGRTGVDLSVILDNIESAHAVARISQKYNHRVPVLIEIDSDGHRAGIKDDDPFLIELGKVLHEGGTELRGVMTHAGSAYQHPGQVALRAMAEQERLAVVSAAERLRGSGLPCPVVSVGSTPTATFVEDLSGVTEVRAGVYVFKDLIIAGLGVCEVDEIAISVLATVIGHQHEKGWILVDAGWMAMSRDRGTAIQQVDQGYGLVCNETGEAYDDLIMIDANQEHGILALRSGSRASTPELPVGTRVRILPNHACATASQFDSYCVLDECNHIQEQWDRFSGW